MHAPHPQSLSLSVQVLWKQQLCRLAAQRLHPVSGGRGPPGARQLLQDGGGALRPEGPPLQHLQGGGEQPSSSWRMQRAQLAIQVPRKAGSGQTGGAEPTYLLARKQPCWAFKNLHKATGTSTCY